MPSRTFSGCYRPHATFRRQTAGVSGMKDTRRAGVVTPRPLPAAHLRADPPACQAGDAPERAGVLCLVTSPIPLPVWAVPVLLIAVGAACPTTRPSAASQARQKMALVWAEPRELTGAFKWGPRCGGWGSGSALL